MGFVAPYRRRACRPWRLPRQRQRCSIGGGCSAARRMAQSAAILPSAKSNKLLFGPSQEGLPKYRMMRCKSKHALASYHTTKKAEIGSEAYSLDIPPYIWPLLTRIRGSTCHRGLGSGRTRSVVGVTATSDLEGDDVRLLPMDPRMDPAVEPTQRSGSG